MEPRLYTVKEVATILNVSGQYVRKMVADGMAQPVKRFGHMHAFTVEEIERLRHRPKHKGGRGKKRPQ